jgi:CheY-like chemotaxis protein
MGGEIKVKSTLNKGSEFCFTTELECRNFQSQKQLFPQCDIKNLKILVVDPNKPALVKTASTLREFNWNVYCCTSAKDAISEINFHDSKKEPFDLVVTEYEMNSITGPMLVQSIQNSQTIKTLPKFVFTSIGHHVELPESADNLGVKGIAIKPITSPVLLDAIMLSYDKFVHCGKCNIPTKQQFKSKIKDLKNTKILLVEDDEINQEICTELLEQFGFQVTIASNGIQALESVSQFHFDLVLLDIQLPDLDGYKVAETIRLEDKLKELPIIALSSNTRPDDIKQCKLSGMNAHIAKPVIPVTLLSTISKWIQTEHIPTPSFDDSRSSSELQKIQGLDISSGLKNVGGNEDFYKRILLKFAHQYKDNILKTGTALLRKEYEKAHLLTHNLKSITGNIGALDIHLKISTLNQIIRNRNQPDKSKLEEAHRALAELCSSIENSLKPEHKSGSPWLKQCSDTKKELFTKEIETLQKLVAQNDVSAKTKYSKIQQEYRFEEFREFFSNLETFLDKYEFEKADNYIKEYIS